MRSLEKIPISLVVVLTAALTAISLSGQSHPNQSVGDPNKEIMALFQDYPIVSFNPGNPTKPEGRERRARSLRHNNKNLNESSAKLFIFQEKTDAVSLTVPTAHSPDEIALPVNQSNAVVIGNVRDAQAYLSSDNTNVYSEFTVGVEEILKDNSAATISTGGSLTAERAGGRVRLPSGRVILRGDMRKSMPVPGRRYLLFLEFNEEVQTYSILTGYELRAGQTFPLDGNRRFKEGQKYEQLVGYDRYEGVSEITFLNEVREAIASSATNK